MRYAKRVVALLAISCLAAACGGEFTSALPTAPSSATPTGATISGVVNGMSASAATSWTLANSAPAGITVAVVGTNISTTVSGTGTFVLTGVPPGDVRLRFTGAGVDATVTITGVTVEQIQIVITLTGSNANVDRINRTRPSGPAEIEGLIDSISYGDRSMKVAGVEVKVRNAPVRHGSSVVGITMLAVGHRVQVKGTWEHDYIVASEVVLKDTTPSPNAGPSPDGPTLELQGFLKTLAGSCPAVTFTLNDTPVATGVATSFRHGPCAHLEEGSWVVIQGRRGATGTVVAEKIEMKEVKLAGPVSTITGACPTLTLLVNGSTVKTDAFTTFERLPCGGFAPTVKVEVTGTEHPNHLVKATRVKYEGN